MFFLFVQKNILPMFVIIVFLLKMMFLFLICLLLWLLYVIQFGVYPAVSGLFQRTSFVENNDIAWIHCEPVWYWLVYIFCIGGWGIIFDVNENQLAFLEGYPMLLFKSNVSAWKLTVFQLDITSKFKQWFLNIFILFTNPSARAGYDTRSIFKRSLTGLNSDFPSPRLVA